MTDPGKRMIKRICDGWAANLPVLKLAQMSGLSTEAVMRVIQKERQRLSGRKETVT